MRIRPDVALVSAWALRWGNPDRAGFRCVLCGCEIHAERRFGALGVPSRITVGWHFGTPDYRPFLAAEVRELRPAANY